MPDKEVQNALLSGNPHEQLAIAYHLIVDNKRIEDETSKLDFQVASSPPPFENFLNKEPRHNKQKLFSSGSSRDGGSGSERVKHSSGGGAEKGRATPPAKKAKWHLGIRSQSRPQDIMNEVYRAMKMLDFVSILTFTLIT